MTEAPGWASTASKISSRSVSIAANWNFGIIKVGGVYERLDYDTPTGSLKRNFWGISGTIPMGPGSWYLFYGRANDGKGGAADGERVAGLAKGSDTSSNQWEVSYTYPFSKRTQVYAGYVKIDNDSNASYTFNINSYPIGVGGKPGGLVFGMIHLF